MSIEDINGILKKMLDLVYPTAPKKKKKAQKEEQRNKELQDIQKKHQYHRFNYRHLNNYTECMYIKNPNYKAEIIRQDLKNDLHGDYNAYFKYKDTKTQTIL